jgi:uncharacterized damage-inducible protein DinB
MTRDDLVQALQSTPAVLARLTASLSEEQLRAGHGDENWSIKEVIVHLRDVDDIFIGRMQRMLDEHDPFLPAFDQEAYARERAYLDQDTAQALADFTTLRTRMVTQLLDADLGRTGRHEEAGAWTIGGAAEHLVSHDLQHLAQVARALG